MASPGTLLNLIVIRVADVAASRRFYETVGLRFSSERHGDGPEHLAADFGGVIFEIYPRGQSQLTSGLRLGFRVSSVATTVSSLEQIGAKIVSRPAGSQSGLRAVVIDPDGNRVEIVE
jgi:catechol 2,3-dioxygenase-like lactoylglutathione lyase family enzyme